MGPCDLETAFTAAGEADKIATNAPGTVTRKGADPAVDGFWFGWRGCVPLREPGEEKWAA